MESKCLWLVYSSYHVLHFTFSFLTVWSARPALRAVQHHSDCFEYPLKFLLKSSYQKCLCCWFSVTPFKIDQKKNQSRLINKVQNLGNERRYIYKDPRQDSGQRNISYTRYPKKCFTQTYSDLYGDAMLVITWMSPNMANGNQQKHLLPSLLQKREFILRETHKH